MTWESFYAVCFVFGLLLSVFSFLAGAAHLHVPSAHLHGAGGHGPTHAGSRGASFFNLGTITAFVAWFGGTGYLLTRYSAMWALFALALAAVSGLAGASLVFWFLFRVLIAHDRELDPADYDMIGVLGKITEGIREGGTGEMIFSQQGYRRAAIARSEGGQPIARGTEVVVTQYKGGIAYVRPWEEMHHLTSASAREL